MDEVEINEAAAKIIECLGADAEDHALEMVMTMLNRDDLQDAANWMKIVQAIVHQQDRAAELSSD